MTGHTITLLLGTDDIAKLSSISGNVDIDALVPWIRVAQLNEIKRILGVNLYDKIVTDYENDALAGEYLLIYNQFVVDMLSYFSAANFVKFNPYKITNGGVYRTISPEIDNVDLAELNYIVDNYEKLGNAIELMFNKYIKDNPVPEYTNNCDGDSSYGLSWFLG